MQKQGRTPWLLAAVAVLVLVASACGDDDKKASGAKGSVKVTGSSTVEPISSAAAEAFQAENSDVKIAVTGPGTSDGFKQFCAGEADIADASRPIKEEEVAACAKGKIEYIELKVGFDGMAVLVSPENEVECLNFADLYALLGPESQGVANWSDAADLAKELGSDTELPDQKLDPTGPGEESGTYDSFIEIAFADIAEKRVEDGKLEEDKAETTRANYQSSPNDNTIIQNIEGSKGSLGWVGFAFAEGAGDTVKEVQVSEEPGGKCVAPSAETIADASYPLSRSLYVYVNKAKATEGSAVSAYVDFYLEGLSEFVEAGGYVNLPEDQVTATKAIWTDKTVGTQESS